VCVSAFARQQMSLGPQQSCQLCNTLPPPSGLPRSPAPPQTHDAAEGADVRDAE